MMQTLLRHRSDHSRLQHGFTLIELLLVLLIFGLMVATVRLALPDRSGHELQQFVQRLHGQINLATQQSIYQNADLGLQFRPGRYDFYRWSNGGWQPFDSSSKLLMSALPESVQFILLVEGQSVELNPVKDEQADQPQILFLSDGQISGFELRLQQHGNATGYRIHGSINGAVTLAELRSELGSEPDS